MHSILGCQNSRCGLWKLVFGQRGSRTTCSACIGAVTIPTDGSCATSVEDYACASRTAPAALYCLRGHENSIVMGTGEANLECQATTKLLQSSSSHVRRGLVPSGQCTLPADQRKRSCACFQLVLPDRNIGAGCWCDVARDGPNR